ncbi:MAG: TetR/AcrR family transcriptional regulator [Chloroflexota bacterium]
MSKQHDQKNRNPALSAELFLTTALQLAEEAGDVQKISLRQLGKALNVDPTAVYRYFPSKGALVDAMHKRIVSSLLPEDDLLTGDWQERITVLARQAYRVLSTYPALTIHLPSSPYILTPVGDRWMEIGYQALTDAGLSDEHVVLFHEILYTAIFGIGQIDAQLDIENERSTMRKHIETLPSAAFPNIHRLAHLIVADTDAVFELVLEIYLKAVASYSSGTAD